LGCHLLELILTQTKWQRLQEEANASAAAVQQLQEEKQRLAAELELLKSPAAERRLSNLGITTHATQPAVAGQAALAASPWPCNQVMLLQTLCGSCQGMMLFAAAFLRLMNLFYSCIWSCFANLGLGMELGA